MSSSSGPLGRGPGRLRPAAVAVPAGDAAAQGRGAHDVLHPLPFGVLLVARPAGSARGGAGPGRAGCPPASRSSGRAPCPAGAAPPRGWRPRRPPRRPRPPRASCASESERPGSTGATRTPHEMPMAVRRRSASIRRSGGGVPGSVERPHGAVERPHREAHRDLGPLRCRCEQCSVTQDERRLGQDAEGVARSRERLHDAPRQVVLALGVLVGVGVGAHGDAVAAPLGGAQLGAAAGPRR